MKEDLHFSQVIIDVLRQRLCLHMTIMKLLEETKGLDTVGNLNSKILKKLCLNYYNRFKLDNFKLNSLIKKLVA